MTRAIDDWKVNLIRLPLAQDRWFGKMTNQMDGGIAYRKIVDKLVDICAVAHVYIDLDLHCYDLSGVSQGYALNGTNIIYEAHPYPNKKDWDKCFGDVSEKYPVYVGEWGFVARTNWIIKGG